MTVFDGEECDLKTKICVTGVDKCDNGVCRGLDLNETCEEQECKTELVCRNGTCQKQVGYGGVC